jgi:hypothetical protein
MTFRPWPVVQDALSNIAARRVLWSAIWVASTLVILGVGLNDAAAIIAARKEESDLVGQGYATLLVSTQKDSGVQLRPEDCEALADIGGVVGATWMREPPPWRLYAERGPIIPVRIAGKSALEVLAVRTDLSGWRGSQGLLDAKAVSAAGRTSGDVVTLKVVSPTGEGAIDAFVTDLGSLGGGSAGSLLVFDARPDPVDRCVLAVDPERRAAVLNSTVVQFSPARGFSEGWAMANADRFAWPLDRFHSRNDRWAWLVATVAITGMWALSIRIRRADTALYTALGLTSGEILVIGLTSVTAVFVTACAAAFVGLWVSSTHAGAGAETMSIALAAAGRAAVGATLSSACLEWASATASRSSVLVALRER